ncbi:MAG TPA: AMP-binding protein [Geminicoccus sp.]|uniref:class I adenylate-forming enzyme family protein n=1 Tax=Geminicoccus sp. TaxID=2024832 RepID=UPI002C9EFB69|nr:AMP-binding protein [Geminicoccus sp.]HWL68448.1 AMP-binding protein [Geminicoccus sp.]
MFTIQVPGPEQPYIAALVAGLREREAAPVIRHQGQDVTAAAFLGTIYRHARVLAGQGIGRGSLVALFAPNHPEALAIRYAAHLLGAAAVFLSVPGTAERRVELLAQIAPDLLVLFAETAGLLPEGVRVRRAAVGIDLADALRLDRLAKGEPGEAVECLARPDDLAVIVSSGGTTGVPKGSCRSFATYSAMVHAPSNPGRRQLVNGHLAYLSQVLVDITLIGGGTVVLDGQFEPAATLAMIEAERITDLFLVEPQLFELMDHPEVGQRDLSSLRVINHIGASAPATLRRRAHTRLGPVIAHTYGASEIGLVSVLTPAEHDPAVPERFTCAGRIFPGVEVRFRGADGALVAHRETGGIEVRSPAMAAGYRNRLELQAASFQDGWYRTGDLGRLDPDGYLHVLGRTADIAWVDGQMVSPTLLEDLLCGLPDVRYAVVVAEPDGAARIAAMLPWPGGTIDLAACAAAVLAGFGTTVVRSMVWLPLERMPLTEQGKPDQAAIRELGQNALPAADLS